VLYQEENAMANVNDASYNTGVYVKGNVLVVDNTDAKFWGTTTGTYLLWDASANTLTSDGIKNVYLTIETGTVTGEEHGVDIAHTGTVSSGDSLVGLNVVTTGAGSGAAWNSAAYFKYAQASKAASGYFCAAEFEVVSTAAGASDHAGIVINMTNNHTGSVPVSPYIMLRDYGTTHADCFVRIYGDTGQSGTTSATTLITTVSNGYEANCDYAVRCMLGSTPIWLLATSTAAS
jgi:hypothetical protein